MRVVLARLIAAQLVGLSFYLLSRPVVNISSMKSMAGMIMVRLGVEQEKKSAASFRI